MNLDTTDTALVERLAKHRVLGDAPPEELAWLVSHGTLKQARTGDLLSSPKLGPVEELFIILSGRIGMYMDRGGAPRRVIEWRAGDVTGLLPYSRLTVPPGSGRAEEPTDYLAIHGRHLREMSRECPEVTTRLVRQMLDRARHFQQESLHDARLASLGRLAAGLAHELDNPASAVIRSAKLLVSLVGESDAASRALGEAGMAPSQLREVERLRDDCLTAPVHQVRSPLEQGRHEEAIVEWLDARKVSIGNVETLAETPVTIAMLDRLAETVDPELLEPALRWVAAGCAVRVLAGELSDAATRISDLVKAVKGFTQMDHAATPQPVDVGQGLAQTLAVLKSKARAKAVKVTVEAEPGLPPVRAVAGELNQVWANLIENAIDAVAEGGSVQVSARMEGSVVVVCVLDDGPGIPPEVQDQVFEPFFTTKPVGKGTGLGLDIVRRLVDRHRGAIDLSSVPGRTAFRVSLPTAEAATRGSGE